MKSVYNHAFRGKRYKIKFVNKVEPKHEDTLGTCNPPTKKRKCIKISKNLTPKEELEVVIHEAQHACFWDMDEEAIYESARDIAQLLWRLGYRKVEG